MLNRLASPILIVPNTEANAIGNGMRLRGNALKNDGTRYDGTRYDGTAYCERQSSRWLRLCRGLYGYLVRSYHAIVDMFSLATVIIHSKRFSRSIFLEYFQLPSPLKYFSRAITTFVDQHCRDSCIGVRRCAAAAARTVPGGQSQASEKGQQSVKKPTTCSRNKCSQTTMRSCISSSSPLSLLLSSSFHSNVTPDFLHSRCCSPFSSVFAVAPFHPSTSLFSSSPPLRFCSSLPLRALLTGASRMHLYHDWQS